MLSIENCLRISAYVRAVSANTVHAIPMCPGVTTEPITSPLMLLIDRHSRRHRRSLLNPLSLYPPSLTYSPLLHPPPSSSGNLEVRASCQHLILKHLPVAASVLLAVTRYDALVHLSVFPSASVHVPSTPNYSPSLCAAGETTYQLRA